MLLAIVIGMCIAGGVGLYYLYQKKHHLEYWEHDITARQLAVLASPGVVTAGGHTVHYEGGAIHQDSAALDRGIEHTFQKCECAGYPVNRAQHDIHIVVLKGRVFT